MLCLPVQKKIWLRSKGKLVDKGHFSPSQTRQIIHNIHSVSPVSILQHISVLIWSQAFPLQKAANLSWILLVERLVHYSTLLSISNNHIKSVAEEKQETILLAHILMINDCHIFVYLFCNFFSFFFLF